MWKPTWWPENCARFAHVLSKSSRFCIRNQMAALWIKTQKYLQMKEVVERLRKRLIDQRLRASELGFLSKSAPEIICKISSRHFFPECMQRNLNKPTIQKWNNFDLTTHSLSKSNLEINIAGKIPRQSHDYCELLSQSCLNKRLFRAWICFQAQL